MSASCFWRLAGASATAALIELRDQGIHGVPARS